MRLLVTGGLGFIGSNFVRMELGKHSEILNLDNLSYGSNPANLKGAISNARYSFIKGDVANTTLLRKLVGEVDSVVNFAAESHVDRSISNATPFVRTNVLGVLSILEALRKSSDTTLVHIGTDEEYGEIAKGSYVEESRLSPSSPYAATKSAASMLVQAYIRTYGIKAIITRCTNNFGPYQFPEKLIPKVIIRALLGLKIPIYGTGKNVRDWIFVVDHCEAIDRVIRKGKPGEVYNIASGKEVSNNELVKAILGIMRKPTSLIHHVEDRPGHDLRYSLDATKITGELGFKPRHNFGRALAETVRWYEENESWWRPLASNRTLYPTPWHLKW